MDKYIKAKTIIDFINDCLEHKDKITDIEKATLCAIKKLVERTPAADVEEVLRCKECKYCVEHYDTDGNVPYWVCKEWDSGTDYDGYCHYAERKDGGQDDV